MQVKLVLHILNEDVLQSVPQDVPLGGTQGGTQDDTQDDIQGDTQDDTQGLDLDSWIENEIAKNPKITTEELARFPSLPFYCRPSAQSSAHENFFSKKTHPCGSAYNIAISACFTYHFPLINLQPSAQNPFCAENFCIIIIETQMLKHKSYRKPTDLL